MVATSGEQIVPKMRPPLPPKSAIREKPEKDEAAKAKTPASGPGAIDWIKTNWVPVLISIFWLVALGAYGAGFLSLYDPAGEAVQTPPLLNLLFFCFALFGPLCMIWGVVLIANRSAGLADRVRVQSEVAAKLGEKLGAVESLLTRQHRQVEDRFLGTVRGLEKKVEETAVEMVGTVGLLTDEASDILSKRGAALEQTLTRIENTVNARLDDRLAKVDAVLESGTTRIEENLSGQMNSLNEMLNERISTVDKTMAEGQSRMARLIEKQETGTHKIFDHAAAKLDETLKSSSQQLNTELSARASALEQAINASGERLDRAIEDQAFRLAEAMNGVDAGFSDRVSGNEEILKAFVAEQTAKLDAGLAQINGQVKERVDALADQIDRRLSEGQAGIEAAFARRSDNLEAQNRMLEVDLPRNIGAVEKVVGEILQNLSTNPPASDSDLAARLGKTALDLVGPERQALSEVVKRMQQVEDQVQALIDRMDRTARMNAAFDRPSAAAPAETTSDPALPFAELQGASGGKALDWTLTLRVLELPDEQAESARPVLREAAKDKTLSDLAALARRVQEELAEDGLFLQDLAPKHAALATWQRYAEGERDEAMAQELSGIDDDIALTLARKRLRGEAEFRDLAFRFVAGYQRLIARAVDEGLQGAHLLELAETSTGRAFMLLGQLTNAFGRPNDLFED
ncbi:hypothetical protein KHP62_00855 [Rhodobacteraceae bacterium NNCM2]|nr:hypothetical protein [Coraliihabitans acroporae]